MGSGSFNFLILAPEEGERERGLAGGMGVLNRNELQPEKGQQNDHTHHSMFKYIQTTLELIATFITMKQK